MAAMNERQVQAQINILIQQRDNALNTCVNLNGELAVKDQIIEDLQAQVAMLTALVEGNATPADAPIVAEAEA